MCRSQTKLLTMSLLQKSLGSWLGLGALYISGISYIVPSRSQFGMPYITHYFLAPYVTKSGSDT